MNCMIETKILDQFVTDDVKVTMYFVNYYDCTCDYLSVAEMLNTKGEFIPVKTVLLDNLEDAKDVYCQMVGGVTFAQTLSKEMDKNNEKKTNPKRTKPS